MCCRSTRMRIPLATWYRFRLAAEQARTALVFLTQSPCASSCAALALRCEPASVRPFSSNGETASFERQQYTLVRERNRNEGSAFLHKKPSHAGRMARGNAVVEGAVMYAVLHPPNFCAQAAAQQRPELRKRPFALLDGEPPAEIVFAANKAARSLGVEAGMTRLQAESFPESSSLSPRAASMKPRRIRSFTHIACMFSPRIEYVESTPGTYALDIRGHESSVRRRDAACQQAAAAHDGGWLSCKRRRRRELSCCRLPCTVAEPASRLCRPAVKRTRCGIFPVSVLNLAAGA